MEHGGTRYDWRVLFKTKTVYRPLGRTPFDNLPTGALLLKTLITRAVGTSAVPLTNTVMPPTDGISWAQNVSIRASL